MAMPLRFLADFLRRSPEPQRAAGSRIATGPSSGTDSRFRAVSIRPGEGCCEAARQFGKMRFLCAKAPRLPVPECTSATCSCRYVHHADRRSGKDRRSVYEWTRERQLGLVNRRAAQGRRSTDART
jgi:hypothetical protein